MQMTSKGAINTCFFIHIGGRTLIVVHLISLSKESSTVDNTELFQTIHRTAFVQDNHWSQQNSRTHWSISSKNYVNHENKAEEVGPSCVVLQAEF